MSTSPVLIHIPAKGNAKLARFVEQINAHEELRQLWKCANINAVDRSRMSDHGPVHVQIVANAAYKIFRLLLQRGIVPGAMAHDGLDADDAGVIVVGGALLHDIGMAVQRENHELYGICLAREILASLLRPLYETTPRTVVTAEILHAIVAHQTDEACLTVEAGAVKVADALDMTQGRSRIPFEAGEMNIHAVSAFAIESVELMAGAEKPVRVEIRMHNYAGIYQLDELLKPKLLASSITEYIEVRAMIAGEPGNDFTVIYSL